MNYREEMEEGTVFLEPAWMDAAIIGTAIVKGQEVLAYSYQALIDVVAKNEIEDIDEATEWVEYNTLRALPYMGEQAPVVVYLLDAQ
jgi:hypothetical protein